MSYPGLKRAFEKAAVNYGLATTCLGLGIACGGWWAAGFSLVAGFNVLRGTVRLGTGFAHPTQEPSQATTDTTRWRQRPASFSEIIGRFHHG
jgi:hypothetical protein